MYKCPNCNEKLILDDGGYNCINRHHFDISRYGYVNLLLSNQKHSLNPGDNKEMILSRVDFLSLGYYSFLRDKILELINKYSEQDDNVYFADLACGEGYYTNYIHESIQKYKNIVTVGIDISKYAIIEACKKRNSSHLSDINYCIGNLMNMPFYDESFNIMLNCFALLDVKEFNRVLKHNGCFIRVLPDYDHLYELKQVLYDNVILNKPKDEKLEGFELVEKVSIKDKISLKSKKEIFDLFTMTPYYYKSSKEDMDKLSNLDSLTTIASFVLYVYRKI